MPEKNASYLKDAEHLLDLAVKEDLKDLGDATSSSVIPEKLEIEAVLRTRARCVCAGLDIARMLFKKLDSEMSFVLSVKDGDICEPDTVLARLAGNARSILRGERTALNFLQRLSGIASMTRDYVDAAADTDVLILDTRKTTPGWRSLEKYAVRIGGGTNHRMGLYDRIMIKDNHRILAGMEGAGGIARSVKRAAEKYPGMQIEVEADSLEEVREASEAGADWILLDNMSDDEMRKAVEINAGRSKLEASGGITLERIPSIAATGVHAISVGALTHSAPAVDIGLDMPA